MAAVLTVGILVQAKSLESPIRIAIWPRVCNLLSAWEGSTRLHNPVSAFDFVLLHAHPNRCAMFTSCSFTQHRLCKTHLGVAQRQHTCEKLPGPRLNTLRLNLAAEPLPFSVICAISPQHQMRSRNIKTFYQSVKMCDSLRNYGRVDRRNIQDDSRVPGLSSPPRSSMLQPFENFSSFSL